MKWRNGTTVTEQDTVHVTSTTGSMTGTVGLKLKVPGITILHGRETTRGHQNEIHVLNLRAVPLGLKHITAT